MSASPGSIMAQDTHNFRVLFDLSTEGHVPEEDVLSWYPELSELHLERLLEAAERNVLHNRGNASLIYAMDQMTGPSFNDRRTADDLDFNLQLNRAYLSSASTQFRAITDPSDRTTWRGHHLPAPHEFKLQHLVEVSGLDRDLPNPKHLQDNVMPRLLNDSYISLLRRGTHVDLANFGQTSQAMQEAFKTYRGHRQNARIKAAVKEFHQAILPRLHAIPNEQIATKLWVSGSIANGGILKVVISAWQALAETWRTTAVGIQAKWEASQNRELVPTNIMPFDFINTPTITRRTGLPDRRAANWTLNQAKCRRFHRWVTTTPGLARIHRILAQWKWLASEAQQVHIFSDFARERLREKGLRPDQDSATGRGRGVNLHSRGVRLEDEPQARRLVAYGNSITNHFDEVPIPQIKQSGVDGA